MKKNISSAAAVTVIMMCLTLGSKFFGFIREMFLANFFGTSYIVDAYVMAINIPQYIFAGILGAVATTFIPIYSKEMEEGGRLKADLFTSRTLNMLAIVSSGVAIVGVVFSKQFIFVFAHGWFRNPSMAPTIELATFFVKITFLGIIFSSLAETLDAYQKYHHHYFTPILANYAYSISLITFIIIAHGFGYRWLILGVLAGFFIRFLIDAVATRIRKYRHKWDMHGSSSVKRAFALAVPVFIGSYMTQITILIDKLMASWLPEGNIAALNYSSLVTGLFVMTIGTMVATYLYPKMSRAFVAGDEQELRHHFNAGLGVLFVAGVPISAGCVLYSRQIIQVIFERNAFDAASTTMTTNAFLFYSLGIAAQIPILFLVQVFYSMHNTKSPAIITAVCAGINVIGNLLLIRPLGIRGIALSTSIALIVNLILLLVMLGRKRPGLIARNFKTKLMKICTATFISVGLSYPVFRIVSDRLHIGSETLLGVIPLGIVVIVAVLLYLVQMKLYCIDEFKYVQQFFRKRFRKA
ncbi:MAG: murein biosynthesis integral membrane protein MurJ [Clostridiales Family XIII bacterium]|jgi:putative peptidoglycan lipid II flippase|nr:murein biosynthesis integral membrane protein MurJ [Clostridiales Family XIII bacterium]